MTENHADDPERPDRPETPEPEQHQPYEHTDDEIDRRFDELVADWDAYTAEPIDLDDPEPPPPAPFEVPSQWRAGTGPSIVDRHDEHDDFVPPVEPDLPSDEGFWVTLACLVVGPLWLLYLFFFDRYAAALWWVLAAGVCFAGMALMVLRQPKNRDDDDPFDDGARL